MRQIGDRGTYGGPGSAGFSCVSGWQELPLVYWLGFRHGLVCLFDGAAGARPFWTGCSAFLGVSIGGWTGVYLSIIHSALNLLP